jgi:hypothetical protein
MGSFITLACYIVGALAVVASGMKLLDRNLEVAALLFGSAVGTLAIGYICDSLRVIRLALRADTSLSQRTTRPVSGDDYLDGGQT